MEAHNNSLYRRPVVYNWLHEGTVTNTNTMARDFFFAKQKSVLITLYNFFFVFFFVFFYFNMKKVIMSGIAVCGALELGRIFAFLIWL